MERATELFRAFFYESYTTSLLRVRRHQTVKGICPTGWHLPAWSEFETLIKTAGNLSTVTWIEEGSDSHYVLNVGAKLKTPTTGIWSNANNVDKTNANSGFAALPSGYLNPDGSSFYNLGEHTNFWTSTATSATYAYYMGLNNGYANVYRYNYDKAYSFSVRCLKD